jgi:hypothetical protein
VGNFTQKVKKSKIKNMSYHSVNSLESIPDIDDVPATNNLSAREVAEEVVKLLKEANTTYVNPKKDLSFWPKFCDVTGNSNNFAVFVFGVGFGTSLTIATGVILLNLIGRHFSLDLLNSIIASSYSYSYPCSLLPSRI